MKHVNISKAHPPRTGLTISTSEKLISRNTVTYFSLGKGTDISPETYMNHMVYIGHFGTGSFLLGKDRKELTMHENQILIVEPDTLCGVRTEEGFVYTEIMAERSISSTIDSHTVYDLNTLNGDVIRNDSLRLSLGNHISVNGEALVLYENGNAVRLARGETYPLDERALVLEMTEGEIND